MGRFGVGGFGRMVFLQVCPCLGDFRDFFEGSKGDGVFGGGAVRGSAGSPRIKKVITVEHR